MTTPLRLVTLPAVVALLLVFTFGGCASRDVVHTTDGRTVSTRNVSEYLAKSRGSARTFTQRLGLAVAAADLAGQDIAAGGGERARTLYNQACTEVGFLSRKVTLPATLNTPNGTYHLSAAPPQANGVWDSAYCSELLPLKDIKNRSLVSKKEPSGFGGVLVGVYQPPDPRKLLLPNVGVSFPVTAVVTAKAPSSPNGVIPVTLTLYDPAKRDTARILGTKRTLAADLSAPFGYYRIPPGLGILGMLRPQKILEKEGIFLTQPYDPKKIPLVLIHGLMSDPFMWLSVMAEIEEDPSLRNKYQFWVFGYPTGNPIGYSALELREALAEMYEVYPRMGNMVIVNHSLGGIISHLQVIDSGDRLVQEIFKDKTSEIMALPEKSIVKRGLIFEANPHIDRVVFVAAPHRGAPMATNWIGNFGTRLISLPTKVLSDIGTTALKAAATAAGVKGKYLPNGISGLSAKNPLLIAMNTVPIRVPFHSIIGVAGKPKEPLEKTSDTVVPYWSSHQEAALSEKIVPYPHTAMFVKPAATDEIKRILHLHLAANPKANRSDRQ